MKTMRVLLMSLLGLLLFTACDFYPVSLTIYAEDKQGNDLLDPQSPYFIGSDIFLFYENVEYPLQYDKEEAYTMVYDARIQGLSLRKTDSGWCLRFGELDGSQDYNCAFAIHWPDDSLDWIHYRRFVVMGIVDETWKLNGKRTSMPITVIK